MDGSSILLLFCALAVGVAGEPSSLTKDDDCSTLRTDLCAVDLYSFFLDTKKMPATQEELDATCNILNTGADCVDKYVADCPHVIRKDVADSFRVSTRLAVEDVCKSEGSQLGKKIVAQGKCLKEKLHEGFHCVDEFISQCEAAAIIEPPSQRMPVACCAFLSLDRCVNNHTVAACGTAAARPTRAVLQGFAIFMVEKCLTYLSQPEKCDLSILETVTPSNARKVKSMLPALVDIVTVTFT